jgi:hypothetical protein
MCDDLLLLLPVASTTHSLVKPKKKVYKRITKKTQKIKKVVGKKVVTPVAINKLKKVRRDDPINFDIEFEEDDANQESLDDANQESLDTANQESLDTANQESLDAELDNMLLKARDVMQGDMFLVHASSARNQLNELQYDEEDEPISLKMSPVKRKTTKKPTKTINSVDIKKKGPGRPRNTPKKEPIPKKGITNRPEDDENVVEILYAIPLIFKKIIAFFKSLAAAEIQIIFRPTEIIFYAQDHLKKSRIRVRVDATKLHHYYCRNIVNIGVNCKDLELVLNKVDKDYNSIIILSVEGSTQKSITLILENDMEIDEIHTIGLIGQYDQIVNEREFTDEDYTVRFKYPCKYFRKTIADIKTMSSRMFITQETCDDPLEIGYRSKNKKVRSKHTAKDPEKISLDSRLRPGDSFRVDVKVAYIKPISSAQVADEIWIYVDENKSFMTKALIDDGTIEIKTLTEIIDERPEDD